MIHFAYPNAKEKKEKKPEEFLGCGRYVALAKKIPGDLKDDDPLKAYKIAKPKIPRSKIHQAVEALVPVSSAKRPYVYEKKDNLGVFYTGDSQHLAYLLSRINRVLDIALKTGDIWCTGKININNEGDPFIERVNDSVFKVKLKVFLSEKNKDKLFVVPKANILDDYENLFENEDVKVITIKQFNIAKYIKSSGKKVILTILKDELDLLVKKIFRPKLSLPSLPDPRTILLVIFATSLLFWTQAFEFIYLDSKIERLTISLGDVFMEKNFRNDIALIAIEDKNFGINWRGRHAILITKLCQAGARIIAFDMYFQDLSKFDEDFVGAVKQAKKHGTDVIIGISQFLGKKPEEIKKLEEAASGYGILCINETLLYSTKAPLLVIKEKGDHLDSLSLIIAKTFYSEDIVEVKEKETILKIPGKPIMRIPLSNVEFSRDSCPSIREGDMVSDMFVDLSPAGVLKSPERRFVYGDIISSSWSDDRLRRKFEGKIVLMGVQIPKRDCVGVPRWPENEKCAFGMELHADILNTILSGIHTRVLLKWKQIAFIVAFAVLGAFLACIRKTTSRTFHISLLLLSLIFIFEATLHSYIHYKILLYPSYYAASLIFAYIAERLSDDKKA